MAPKSYQLQPGAIANPSNPNQPMMNVLTAIDCRMSQLYDYLVNNPESLADLVITRLQRSNSMPTGRIMVQPTPTLIRSANSNRVSILIRNTGVDNLYLGQDNNLTIDEGMEIRPNESWSTDTFTGAIYGVSDGVTLDVRYMEETL